MSVNYDGPCLLGDCDFKWEGSKKAEDTILPHLLTEHKIVIASIHTVYDVSQYCNYWRNKLNSINLCEHLHGIHVHKNDEGGPPELYFMLNDASEEDKTVRHKIYLDKLESVLKQQQNERECDKYSIQCLFCPETLVGSRFSISEHLYNEHSFTLGHPDNLVYTVEFIEHLRSKMIRAECLYCDKTFRDYKTLREHMRKKLHKKLNPSNTEFDKYYIINYREFGKTWKTLNNETDDADIRLNSRNGSAGEEVWEDWEDPLPEIKCLICEVVDRRFSAVKQHMREHHYLDLDILTHNLSYYKQVKLINYIRYLISDSKCPFCDASPPPDSISDHLMTHRLPAHITLPHDLYTDERYLFPALDDDYMLCCLKDVLEEEVNVIPEDT